MSSGQSPPKSQGDEDDLVMTDAASATQHLSEETNEPVSPAVASSRSDTNGSNENSDSGHGAPGSAWSTKKFSEEYARAFKSLQDQEWSTAQYGDPLLKR